MPAGARSTQGTIGTAPPALAAPPAALQHKVEGGVHNLDAWGDEPPGPFSPINR